MENNEGHSMPKDEEPKPKKRGFFQRLRRGISSVFQRKNQRKRAKSEPCLPDNKETIPNPDLNSELRLSLSKNNPDNNTDEVQNDSNFSASVFRPVAKAPIFVNDFTAELKKSLKQRSKMVEEGQTSDAIIQMEMTKSHYSVSEEENQAEIERKTFEEKLALFESQISGGSLQNTLNREEHEESLVHTVIKDEEVLEIESNHEQSMIVGVNKINEGHMEEEQVSLEISGFTDKLSLQDQSVPDDSNETVAKPEEFTNYELDVSDATREEIKTEYSIENERQSEETVAISEPVESLDEKLDESTETNNSKSILMEKDATFHNENVKAGICSDSICEVYNPEDNSTQLLNGIDIEKPIQ